MGFHHVESTTDTLEEDILESFIATFWDMNEIEEDAEEAQKSNRIQLDLDYNIGNVEYRDQDDNIVLEVEFDVWYIENWSLLLDVKLIALTIVNMIKGQSKAR